MPTLFRYKGFRFFFYSNEGNPREPAHVHVEQDDREAKFWLRPDVRLAYNAGFNAKALSGLLSIVEQQREQIERAWREFFRES